MQSDLNKLCFKILLADRKVLEIDSADGCTTM